MIKTELFCLKFYEKFDYTKKFKLVDVNIVKENLPERSTFNA